MLGYFVFTFPSRVEYLVLFQTGRVELRFPSILATSLFTEELFNTPMDLWLNLPLT